MGNSVCSNCQKAKAALSCGICHSTICKYCAKFLEEETLSYMPAIPPELSHTVYCEGCYHGKVAGPLADYNQDLESAKEILVFFKNQGKETRLIKRLEDPIQVENCLDHQDVVMRLAFLTLKAGYNGMVDIVISSEKVRTGNYQTLKWKGVGIPARIRADKLLRDKSLEQTPN